ncbi:YesL family protein [Nonomuraea dietziae]|uniref:YesL family protein n=1 Tax=Nonomuraea dietziae TaxID=65515 RepID=UPI0033C7F889
MTGSTWLTRLYSACDEVLWAVRLNLLWIVFTLAGGVVLGLGPATVAAYTLARRHAENETIHSWREFFDVYRREFVRGSLLVLPPAALGTVLAGNYLYFSALGPAGEAPRAATLVALLVLVVITAHLLPLYVRYDLRLPAYLVKASLFALVRPASTMVLLFVFVAVVYVSATLPILALAVGAGAWIQLNTWLCLRFFAENEARLHPKGN